LPLVQQLPTTGNIDVPLYELLYKTYRLGDHGLGDVPTLLGSWTTTIHDPAFPPIHLLGFVMAEAEKEAPWIGIL